MNLREYLKETNLITDGALSSGGVTGSLAAQALWQLLLPMGFFLFTALLAHRIGHYRRGLR